MTGEGSPGPASQAAGGDPGGFEEWFRANFAKLMADMMHAGADYHRAEDAVTAACEDLYRHWAGVELRYAWVRKAAIRKVMKSREHEERNQQIVQQLAGKHRTDEGREDTGLTAWEDKEWVTGLLRELPPRQREVIACIVDEFTPSQAADMLGRTPEAARQALAAARKSLLTELAARHAAEEAPWRPAAGRPVPAAMTASASEETR